MDGEIGLQILELVNKQLNHYLKQVLEDYKDYYRIHMVCHLTVFTHTRSELKQVVT